MAKGVLEEAVANMKIVLTSHKSLVTFKIHIGPNY